MNTPKFITIEGPDGSGKTTVGKRIAAWMNNELKQPTAFVTTPGGTQFANALRDVVFTKSPQSKQAAGLSMVAAMADTFESNIIPNLQQGHHAIACRWTMSTRVYQGFIDNRPLDGIEKMIEAAMPHPRASPDVYIILNAAPEILMQRVIDAVSKDRKSEIGKVKGKGSSAVKQKLAQEWNAEREALEGNMDYYKYMWAAYSRPLVFSGGVTCVSLDTSDKNEDETYDKMREIVMQGVLSN